jgi:hypothetical protein
MICPKCAYEQGDGTGECRRCGVIFAKVHGDVDELYIPNAIQTSRTPSEAATQVNDKGEKLLAVSADENRITLAGRAIIYIILLVWGGRLATSTIESNYVGESFLHLINLPFHEAGHIFFSPLGSFLQYLGGTLGQWLVPFIVLCAFLLKGNPFGATVGLWWLGESFMDIAPYMNDARAGQLVLLGGVTGSEVEDYHDWEIILTKLGWLNYDHLIAKISFTLGVVLMLLSLVWGSLILLKQYKSLKRSM